MTDLNPANIIDDIKSGRLEKSVFIETIKNNTSADNLLKLYQYFEVNRSEESESLKHLMEETLGKKNSINFDLIPKEAMALELLSRRLCELLPHYQMERWVFNRIKAKKGFVERIDIEGINNRIESEYLELFSGLEELEFYDSNITDFSRLKNLTCLRINGMEEPYLNNISEIIGLEKLVNLEEIDLSFNSINEIENLDNMFNLKKLDLSRNMIKEIKGLDSLLNLECLDLSNNTELQDIKNLEALTELESLSLENNYLINEIKGLSTLRNLKKLNLSKDDFMTNKYGAELSYNLKSIIEENIDIFAAQMNERDDIFPYRMKAKDQTKKEKQRKVDEILMKLEEYENEESKTKLDRYRHYITEIKGLENLVKLEELDLSGNQITEIKGLKNLTKLRKLNLDDNQIEEVKSLGHLSKLEYLGIANNNIVPIPELGSLNKRGYSVRDPQKYVHFCQNV
ncbi:MAG: leucine-rich repeat domain-containing protein [Candidatus Thorarchaeota archaeon]